METNKIKKSYVWTALFLIVIPLGIYFWFGLQHLTQFETADEHLWISDPYAGRIQQYWNAFAQKDWKSTDINDKPGVTLALISGIGMRWENNAKDKIAVKGPQWTNYNPQKTQETYRLYRLPIVITNRPPYLGAVLFSGIVAADEETLVGAGISRAHYGLTSLDRHLADYQSGLFFVDIFLC